MQKSEEKTPRVTTNLKIEDVSLKEIISILNLTISQRSKGQNQFLRDLTKSIKFFQQLTQENGEYVHRAVCERLTYEYCPPDSVRIIQYVFHVHTFGNKFYILLEGEVSVIVPFVSNEETQMKTVAVLSSGSAFGELALLKNQPRAASIHCRKECHFAVLSKEDYLNILGKVEARKLDDFIEFLHGIPMFRCWSKKKLEMMTYHFSTIKFRRKQAVFAIGSKAEYVYIVKTGEFELMKPVVVKNIKDHNEEFTAKIALLTKGEVFSDEEVLRNKPYTFTCICYTQIGELLRISAADFKLELTDNFSVQEFKEKRLSKKRLRNPRIENFKKYLVGGKPVDEGEKKIFIKETLSIKRSVHKPSLMLKEKFNPRSFETFRKKALGRVSLSRGWISVDHHNETEAKPNLKSSGRSLSSMKCHRPGGYYRANLKKSWIGYQSISSRQP